MKRLAIVLGVILLAILLIAFLSTSSVDTTPYFEEEYYKNTVGRLDSITADNCMMTRLSVRAGFSKASITPGLGHSEDNDEEGTFIQMPLAGFGAREGKPATGVHDSVFVKAVALNVGTRA